MIKSCGKINSVAPRRERPGRPDPPLSHRVEGDRV